MRFWASKISFCSIPCRGRRRAFTPKSPFRSKADVEGAKFRAYNSATARVAELLGMQPVQIEAAELSQALATGIVDAFVSSGSTGYDRKVWEQLTHFYRVDAWLPRNYVVANKDAWEALSPPTRRIVRGLAQLAERAGLAEARRLADWYVAQLAANGMQVQTAKGQFRADLEAVGETMTAEWLEQTGAAGEQIIESFRR